MRRYMLCFLGLTLIGPIHGGTAGEQDKAPATAQAASGPHTEFLSEITYYEQRYTRLAEAMPAEKYTWSPGEGVRSVGEVYIHIAMANYGVGRVLGGGAPGVDLKSFQSMATDKAKTVQALKDSFAYIKQTVAGLSDADADRPQKMFGQQTTLRGSFILVTGHFGEHLGQSIAYARVNGIVPPWTEEQQQQRAKATGKPKQ